MEVLTNKSGHVKCSFKLIIRIRQSVLTKRRKMGLLTFSDNVMWLKETSYSNVFLKCYFVSSIPWREHWVLLDH